MSRLSAVVLAALLLTGCGGAFDLGLTSELSTSKLQDGLKDGIKSKTGIKITSATCDGPLKGEKGATQRCKVVDTEGQTIEVTVIATDVKGSQIYFNWAVNTESAGSTP
ncbi:DUF4333 domain-containing protein [Mycobacterium sp. NPDC050853]|uniref:DUF4333 domain-containing protein n=1 Tax=Mycobacteriaceae TaxID=1762 RepID=UPI0015DE629C|nr:DUF4333 domain-containing protein [Mycobacteroides sp. LB1]